MKKAPYQKYRKSLLFLLIFNLLGDISFALPVSPLFIHILSFLLYTGMGMVGAYFFYDISRANHKIPYIIGVFTLCFAVSASISYMFSQVLIFSFIALLTLKISLFFFLIRYIFKKSRHTNDIVIAIITTFLLLGSIYTFIYWTLTQLSIQWFAQAAFAVNGNMNANVSLQNLFFYSYTMLTHTGLTNITPTIYISQFICTTENIISILYIIFTTAHLAAMYGNWRNKPYNHTYYDNKKPRYYNNNKYYKNKTYTHNNSSNSNHNKV